MSASQRTTSLLIGLTAVACSVAGRRSSADRPVVAQGCRHARGDRERPVHRRDVRLDGGAVPRHRHLRQRVALQRPPGRPPRTGPRRPAPAGAVGRGRVPGPPLPGGPTTCSAGRPRPGSSHRCCPTPSSRWSPGRVMRPGSTSPTSPSRPSAVTSPRAGPDGDQTSAADPYSARMSSRGRSSCSSHLVKWRFFHRRPAIPALGERVHDHHDSARIHQGDVAGGHGHAEAW